MAHSNAAPGGDQDDEDEAAPPVPGMHRTSPEAALRAEQEAAAHAAAEAAAAMDKPIGEDKLKTLKERARKDIEERLVAQRKRRRLLKGGDASDVRRV